MPAGLLAWGGREGGDMVPRRGFYRPLRIVPAPLTSGSWSVFGEGTNVGAALPWVVFILEQCCRTGFPGEDGEGLLMQFKQLPHTPPPPALFSLSGSPLPLSAQHPAPIKKLDFVFKFCPVQSERGYRPLWIHERMWNEHLANQCFTLLGGQHVTQGPPTGTNPGNYVGLLGEVTCAYWYH